MDQLKRLVRQFVDAEIDYPAFHAKFVRDFLAVRHDDVLVDDLVNSIESACADLDEGDVSESELREELSVVATAPVISVEMKEMNDSAYNGKSFSSVIVEPMTA